MFSHIFGQEAPHSMLEKLGIIGNKIANKYIQPIKTAETKGFCILLQTTLKAYTVRKLKGLQNL
jgi:hypothetical protein